VLKSNSDELCLAVGSISRAIFLAPLEPAYYYHRAEAYLRVNDFESAISNFRKAALLINDSELETMKPASRSSKFSKVSSEDVQTNQDSPSSTSIPNVSIIKGDNMVSANVQNPEIVVKIDTNSSSKSPEYNKRRGRARTVSEENHIKRHQLAQARAKAVNSRFNYEFRKKSFKKITHQRSKSLNDKSFDHNIRTHTNVKCEDTESRVLKKGVLSSSNWLNIRLRRVCFTWGQILLDQKRYHEALKYFEISKNLGMNTDSVLARMTVCYICLDMTEDALEFLYMLTERNPTVSEYYILRAKIYKEMDNVDFVNIGKIIEHVVKLY
jgi:tetratricopeptide (TPR) repeat protein